MNSNRDEKKKELMEKAETIIDQSLDWQSQSVEPARARAMEKTLEINWYELGVVLAFFIAAFIWIATHSSGPVSYDELQYMNVAFNISQKAHILNRYFHIYLLKLFFWRFSDPLIGVKYFWAFLASVTGFFIYFNARMISKTILPAIVAVVIYAAQHRIFTYTGVAYVDFTLMTLFTIGLAIYLLLPYMKKRQHLLLISLGAVIYFAFRTKETGISLGILLLGLGFLDSNEFNWRTYLKKLLKDLRWVAIGIVSGLILMTILDQIFLGDALFSLRPSNIEKLLNFNTKWMVTERVRKSDRFGYLVNEIAKNPSLLGPFTLYLLSIYYPKEQRHSYIKIVWLLPLALLVFLFITSWFPIPRFFIPVLPIISILSAQFLVFEKEKSRTKIIIAFILGLLAIEFYYFLKPYINKYISLGGYSWEEFHTWVLYPFLLTLMLGFAFMIRKWNATTIMIPLVLIFLMLSPELKYDWGRLDQRVTVNEIRLRFYPFEEFYNEITYAEDMTFFISNSFSNYCQPDFDYGILGKDRASNSWMFNLFFKENSREDQFIYADISEYTSSYDQYTYAFLTWDDWYAFPEDIKAEIAQDHVIENDSMGQGILFFIRSQ